MPRSADTGCSSTQSTLIDWPHGIAITDRYVSYVGQWEFGVEVGDEIVSVNGKEVGGRDEAGIIEMFGRSDYGHSVRIEVRRNHAKYEAFVAAREQAKVQGAAIGIFGMLGCFLIFGCISRKDRDSNAVRNAGKDPLENEQDKKEPTLASENHEVKATKERKTIKNSIKQKESRKRVTKETQPGKPTENSISAKRHLALLEEIERMHSQLGELKNNLTTNAKDKKVNIVDIIPREDSESDSCQGNNTSEVHSTDESSDREVDRNNEMEEARSIIVSTSPVLNLDNQKRKIASEFLDFLIVSFLILVGLGACYFCYLINEDKMKRPYIHIRW